MLTDVRANKGKRTFTIRKYAGGRLFVKYRTLPFSRVEFEALECMTERDWNYWLSRNDAYYVVTKR